MNSSLTLDKWTLFAIHFELINTLNNKDFKVTTINIIWIKIWFYLIILIKLPKLGVNLHFIGHWRLGFYINFIISNCNGSHYNMEWMLHYNEYKSTTSEFIWTHSRADQLKPTNPDWVQKRPSAQKIHRRK